MVVSHALIILAEHEDLVRNVRRRALEDADLSLMRLGSTPGR
jgi:hypothetical protein